MAGKAFSFKDKKGHFLFQVYIRETSKSGPQRIKYLYCPKCNQFHKEVLEVVLN